jgi:ubiquinone/menaquinone biosynthesis C-methylase UbiE
LTTTRAVHVTGLDFSRVFTAEAGERLAKATLRGSAEIILGPARDYPLPDRPFDVGLCIGATMALGDLAGALDWMVRAVRPGGRIAIGEPFAARPMPADIAARWTEYDRTIADVGEMFQDRGFDLTGIVGSSTDDWDHYESQHWRAAANFVAAHPDDPDVDEIKAKSDADRARYLAIERDCFGWAIFVARRIGGGTTA